MHIHRKFKAEVKRECYLAKALAQFSRGEVPPDCPESPPEFSKMSGLSSLSSPLSSPESLAESPEFSMSPLSPSLSPSLSSSPGEICDIFVTFFCFARVFSLDFIISHL